MRADSGSELLWYAWDCGDCFRSDDYVVKLLTRWQERDSFLNGPDDVGSEVEAIAEYAGIDCEALCGGDAVI